MIAAEIEQVKAAKFACYKYGFISGSGFRAEETEDTILISLEKLYENTAAEGSAGVRIPY